ncbi:MAG TPA: hypothetical protein VGC97_19715 [Pyrinomonadaceae bacterium]
MKKTTLKTIGSMMLAVLLAAAFAQIPVFAQEDWEKNSPVDKDDSSDNKSIVGVWQTTVTPVNCQTGVPVAPSFKGLITFDDGGTIAETGGTGPALRGPGHGIWKRSGGGRQFTIAFTFLRYNSADLLIGSNVVRQVIQVDGDNSTSSGTVQIIDLNGNVLGSGCSTATGTRFE